MVLIQIPDICINMEFTMKKAQVVGLILFTTISFAGSSQIELGGEQEVKKTDSPVEKTKVIREKDGSTEVYVVSNWSHTTRKLEMNGAPFGDPLGEREFETGLNKWSFGIGFRNSINPFLAVQGGVGYTRNGESYLFEETDTLFKYTTSYAYISMPVKAFFTYGDEIKLLVGGGLTPQLFSGYVQKQEWRDPVDATGEETIEKKNGFSTFVLSAAVNVGVQFQFSQSVSLLLMPEYRIQLTDSYEKTNSFNHYGRAIGFDLGLTFKL